MLSLQTMTTTHQRSQNSDVITLEREGVRQKFISRRRGGVDELAMFDGFPALSGDVAAQLVFGGCSFEAAARDRMAGPDWPVLWVQGDVCPGTHVSGTQAFVIEGQSARRVVLGGRVVGSAWSDADADYCLLAGILPTDIEARRGSQTLSCFEQIEAALQQAGMDFSHLVRTWLYLDHLLDWYGEFNAARTTFFQSREVFDRLIPASTGIGASNSAGAALACGALAIRPRHSGVRVFEVASPLQGSATEYRSSFSRAVEAQYPDHRTLMISGTASIGADGKSLFAEDVTRQIDKTLDVVEAILQSREMSWKNAVRAVGYFHDIQALPLLDACCQKRGIPALPLTPVHATVCRADLLFEMELDAVAAR